MKLCSLRSVYVYEYPVMENKEIRLIKFVWPEEEKVNEDFSLLIEICSTKLQSALLTDEAQHYNK